LRLTPQLDREGGFKTGSSGDHSSRSLKGPKPKGEIDHTKGRRHDFLVRKNMSVRTKAELLLATITAVWGATFVVVKGALADASPLVFIAIRFSLAGLLLALVLGRGLRDIGWGVLGPGLLQGVFLFGGYALQTWGLIFTTPTKSAFITGFSVVLVPLILAAGGAPLRLPSLAAALTGLAGLYVLLAPSGAGGVNPGDLLTLGGSVSFAFQIVLVGRYAERLPLRAVVPVQITAVGLLAAVSLPFSGHLRLEWTPSLLGAFAITTVFATAFAFSGQNWAQQYTPPSHTALIFALEPVFAAVTSFFVAGERMGPRFLAGCALILGGMVISEFWGGRLSPVES
jgi:drug/metabolite transporter (DMT)-like permease